MDYQFDDDAQHTLFDRIVDSEDFVIDATAALNTEVLKSIQEDLEDLGQKGLIERRGWHYFPTARGLRVAQMAHKAIRSQG